MPEFDSSKVTAVIAVAAIVSPILTSVINNIFHLLLKRRETKQELYKSTVLYKREIVENYIRASGRFIATGGSLEEDYKEYYFLTLLYVPDSLGEKIVSVNTFMDNYKVAEANAEYEKLIPDLQAWLKQL